MENQFMGTFTIGQTLDRGFRLYRKIIGRVFFLIIASGLLGLNNMRYISFNSTPTNPFAIFTPYYFISIIIGVWVWVVSVRYIYEKSIGNDLSFGQMLKLGSYSDILLIITLLIWYVAMFIGSILLLLPGLYILNISLTGIIIVIIEKKYFFSAYGRAFKLTRGRWWKTFVINFIAFMIVLLPSLAGYSLALAPLFRRQIPMVVDATAATSPFSLLSVVGFLAYMVIIALTIPILTSIAIVHYNSLRSEKEHSDIGNQLDALEQSPVSGA